MSKFRKKPVVIEAVQLTQAMIEKYLFDGGGLPNGLRLVSAEYHTADRRLYSFCVGVQTLEGFMKADVGDWIIKDVKGEYYPCKPDIFEATYEAID